MTINCNLPKWIAVNSFYSIMLVDTHNNIMTSSLLIFVRLIFSQCLIGWWLRCGWSRSRLTYMWVSGHGACLTSFWEACMCFCFSTWRTGRPASGWRDSTRYKHTQSPVLMRAWYIFVVFVEYLFTMFWSVSFTVFLVCLH